MATEGTGRVERTQVRGPRSHIAYWIPGGSGLQLRWEGSRVLLVMVENGSVWINGGLSAPEEAGISPFDHGLTVGTGVFETLVAKDGAPFAFTRHYKRLTRSAEVLGMEAPSSELLREAMTAVMGANGLDEGAARVRITVTGGEGPLGSDRGAGELTVIVAAVEAPVYGEMVDVAIVPYTRNESGALVGVKSTSYGENVVALARAKKAGAGEAIFGNTQHQLCEGSGSNVFLMLDDHLVTPPLSSGCLAGVTRALVLELCGREGIPVERKPVPLTALAGAEEAFLTSTTREVQPIRSVDGVDLRDVPGEMTLQLREAFQAWAAKDIDP
ncbi:MAG: aminotransferase class IV, partial [Akkermansiaceae bacterium]|nr:aminotransferase class IV [Akkermansiaceae bacterium]